MFGDDAIKLITESRRSIATETLPKYDSELVRKVCLETRLLHEEIRHQTQLHQDSLSQDRALVCALTVQHLATRRNKRCLLAYHAHRLDHLEQTFWASGGALQHTLNEGDTRSKLSPHEADFLKAYNDLVLDYKNEFIDVFDLGGGVERPPKELMVTVRVVRDCGVVMTEKGPIDFQKGQRFTIQRSDVERLLVQGYIEEVQ